MKLIIAGGRDILHLSTNFIEDLLKLHINPYEIVSGGANGIDMLGEEYANKKRLPIKRFLPDWNTYGRRAGPLRNAEMAEYADGLLLIWNGWSPGSASMKKEILKRNKFIREVILK